MSRPKIPGNKRSRVLYTRDAYNTLLAVLHMWGVDNMVSLQIKNAAPGDALLDVSTSADIGFFVAENAFGHPQLNDFDEDSDVNDWYMPIFFGNAPTSSEAQPAVNWQAGVETSDNPVLGTWSLITLEKAAEWFTAEFGKALQKYNLRMMRRALDGKRGRYRATCQWIRAQVRSGVYLKLGIERLQQVCLTQRRRAKGPQLIQTTKPITAPYYQSFLFNGTHAIRLPQGRPALSKAEWLRRYFERKKRAKKTDITHKDASKEVKVPQPQNGRPSRKIEQEIQTNRPAVRQYESLPTFEPDTEFDWSEHGREFVEKLTEEISKGLGEKFGEFVTDKFKEITGL